MVSAHARRIFNRHPFCAADSLYVEKIDVGDKDGPRQVRTVRAEMLHARGFGAHRRS